MRVIHPVVAALALGLGAGGGWAQEERGEPPMPPVHAVVLAEDETEEGAEAKREAYLKRAPEDMEVGEGYPRVLPSSALPGLPAERYLVVLGLCEERSEAQAAARRVKRAAPGVRVVVTPAEDEVSCPGRSPPESPWELVTRTWVGPLGGKDAQRAWFVYRQRHEPENCPGSVRWRLHVREGARLPYKQELGTVCSAPLGDGDDGESSQWRVEPMELGSGTVLHVHRSHKAGGDTAYNHWLYGYCGRLVKKDLGLDMELADSSVLEVERREGEGDRPAVVRVTRWGNPTRAELPLIEEHTWVPAQCAFRTRQVRAQAE